jgi:hypothetical protein
MSARQGVSSIVGGMFHTLALLNDGRVLSCGANTYVLMWCGVVTSPEPWVHRSLCVCLCVCAFRAHPD